MIKTDPSQTKMVVVLLVILAIAVVATVMRIHPSQQAAAATTAAATTQADSAAVTVVPAFQSSRNPFRRPTTIDAVPAGNGRAGIGLGSVMVQEGGARRSGEFKISPLPVASISETGKRAGMSADEIKPDTPKFELLATVGGPSGMTAVIRTGESDTRVVAVGDVLDGHYKVQKLEEGRAVLTDGRDTVVVKRPSS